MSHSRPFLAGLLLAAAVLTACGGGSTSPSPTPPPSSPPPSPTPGSAVVVTVGAGQEQQAVNIAVVSPATPTLNAEALGVTELGSGGSAFNTGATIPRGTSKRVLMFGPGLSGSLQVTVGGPADILVSNVRSVTSQSGTDGLSFDAAVAADAAPGARSVILRNSSNNNITVFTGGLEVVP